MPFFSIIIPVYNVKQYLGKCLESTLSQSFTDFECILVDDGSKDGSSELCDELACQDTRIRVVHKENEGVAIARNTGIRMAAGDFLMFLDSDDTFSLDLLEMSASKLKQTNSDILVFGYQRVKDNGMSIYQSLPEENCSITSLLNDGYDLSFLLWNKIYAKKLFDGIDLERLKGITFSEDSILTIDLLSKSDKICFLPIIGYNYLCRENSATQGMTAKHNLDELKATEIIADILQGTGYKNPRILSIKKFNAKFFLINPDKQFSMKKFLSNCKDWRQKFPDVNNLEYGFHFVKTRLMRMYVSLIINKVDFLAYFLYKIRKRMK